MRKLITFALATIFAFTSIAAAANKPNAFVEIYATEGSGLSATIGEANFGRIDHSFDTQTIENQSIVIDISDTRGTGEGWNVTISGSDFVAQNGRAFGINNLALQAPVVQTVEGQDYETHAFDVHGVDSIQTDGESTKIASAQPNTGVGEYTLTHGAALTVPAGTLIGSYQSTLTVSISTGP